jgi:osmotically inducible protein OsmC
MRVFSIFPLYERQADEIVILRAYYAGKGGKMNRKANALWKGGLKDGKGVLSTESKALSNIQYSFSTRFENGVGTNPEELIGAAHAGCFSMALAGQMGNSGLKPESILTDATVTLDRLDKGWTVTAIHLNVAVSSPGADPAVFQNAAEEAKKNCPISRLLNAKITMEARLL